MNDVKLFKHSFNFFNLNYSFRQGEFVYHTLLSRCGDPLADQQYVMQLQREIELLSAWSQELWKNNLLMSEQTKASMLLDMLQKCRQALPGYVQLVRARIEDEDPQENDIPFMMALLARQAYTQENFVKATVAYAEHIKHDGLADRWRQYLPSIDSNVAEVADRLERFLNTPKDETLFLELCEDCDGISEIIEAQLGDIDEVIDGYAEDLKGD